MTHIKTIKRENGTKIKIQVGIHTDYQEVYYHVRVYACAAGKRKFFPIESAENGEFPGASHNEILEAKLELWQKNKPELMVK
ncbi:MAG: hypothetical protein ACUZ8H_13180 [Candidatus Anammoxibacter sp.]